MNLGNEYVHYANCNDGFRGINVPNFNKTFTLIVSFTVRYLKILKPCAIVFMTMVIHKRYKTLLRSRRQCSKHASSSGLILTAYVLVQCFTSSWDWICIFFFAVLSARRAAASLVSLPRLSRILSHSACGIMVTCRRSTLLGRRGGQGISSFSEFFIPVALNSRLNVCPGRVRVLFFSDMSVVEWCLETALHV